MFGVRSTHTLVEIYNRSYLITNFHFHFQNKWISQAVFMKDYVEILQRTVDTMRDYVYSPNDVWTEEIHEDWIGKLALMGGMSFLCQAVYKDVTAR